MERMECRRCGVHTRRTSCGNCGSSELEPVTATFGDVRLAAKARGARMALVRLQARRSAAPPRRGAVFG